MCIWRGFTGGCDYSVATQETDLDTRIEIVVKLPQTESERSRLHTATDLIHSQRISLTVVTDPKAVLAATEFSHHL
jgi:hypothetical protein